MNYLYCNGRPAPAVSCDVHLKAHPHLPNAFDLIPTIDGLIISLEFCMWLHVIWFPQGFLFAWRGRTMLPQSQSQGSQISLIFRLGNLVLVHPTEMKYSKAADTRSGEGDGEINGKQRKAQRATGNWGGKPGVQLSLSGNLHIDHKQRVKKGRKKNRRGGLTPPSKCSRVYRKPLRKGKEKQPPIPQIHTTDGIPFTSRRDSATNSSFRATKSHSVFAVWSLGVNPSTSSHLSLTSSVGSGVTA